MDVRRLTLAILGANCMLVPIELAVSPKALANSIAQPATAFSEAKTSKQENAGTPESGESFSPNISPSSESLADFSLKDDLFFSLPASIAQILPEDTPNPTSTQTAPDSLANILGQLIFQELPNLVQTISPNVRSQVTPNLSTTETETQLQPNIVAELLVQQLPLLSDFFSITTDLQVSSQTETELQANIISELFVQQIPLLADVYIATTNLQVTSQTEVETQITPPAPPPPAPPPPAPPAPAPPAPPPPAPPAPAPAPPAPAPPPPAPAPVAVAAPPPAPAPVAVAAAPPPPPPAPVAVAAAPPPPPPAPVAVAAAPPPPPPAPVAVAAPPPPPPAPVAVAAPPPPPPPAPKPKPVPPKPRTQIPNISSASIQEKPVSANPIWWIPLAIIAALTAVVLFLLERQTFRRRNVASSDTPNVEFVALSDAGRQTIPSNQPLSMNFNIGLAIRLDPGKQTLKFDRSLVSSPATRGNL